MWTLIQHHCSSKSLSITSGMKDIVPSEATDISPAGQTLDVIGYNVPATAVVEKASDGRAYQRDVSGSGAIRR